MWGRLILWNNKKIIQKVETCRGQGRERDDEGNRGKKEHPESEVDAFSRNMGKIIYSFPRGEF